MKSPRTMAIAFTTLFVATALAPLVGASTEPTPNGDVVINGAFADARPVGHPLKAYAPGGDTFVAFDWRSPADMADQVSLVEGGIRIAGDAFIQQHFNGSEAPDRLMELFHVTLQGKSLGASSSGLRVEIRADGNGDSVVESYTKTVSFSTSSSTIDVTAADLGVPAGAIKMRSIRLWASANADLQLSRVSVYATNGVEGRNLNILPAGDDVTTQMDGVMLVNPGDDGKYSFLVGMAADSGVFLPTLDAWLCVYSAEQAFEDQGFPSNSPTMCADAFVKANDARITKTREGDAFRIDIDARAITPASSQVPAVAIYATVKVDASYDIETPGVQTEFKSGYFNLARLAATQAGAGVSLETLFPTPILVDADADGIPDHVQTQESDGYSVIITPRLAKTTPAISVVAADASGEYTFDVQVYEYDGATGAAMDLPGGISLGLFDASSAIAGGSADATPFWRTDDEGTQLERIDAKTWRVHVPASEVPVTTPVGAWAFYNVGEGQSTNAFGRSTSSTDFYSAPRNMVKDFAVADAMRTAMTPILLGAPVPESTVVIRLDADADAIVPLDGTIALSDNGDGTVTFEYAMFDDGGIRPPVGPSSHALYLFDAAGAASDDFALTANTGDHAEWYGAGTLQSDGWFRVDVPVSAFADAKGPVGAWAFVDDHRPDGLVSRGTWYNPLKPAAVELSVAAAHHFLNLPTPIVLLDAELGIPATLVSAMAGAGTDLVSPTNPLLNPGFEATFFVEGRNERTDNTGATMNAPPWFFRLDDKGTNQPTDPRSTHEVVNGKGRLADPSLLVSYHVADKGKSLMLGQLLGNEMGGDALIWRGASGVSFDYQPLGSASVQFTGVLRYLKADGTLGIASATTTMAGGVSTWKRVSLPMSVPADGKLLGFYLVMDAAQSANFYLDNLVLEGAKTALGDARSDLADGFAVVIEPVGLTGATQDLVAGVDGDHYAYRVEVVDYTQGGAQALDLTGLERSFALRTQDLQKETGFTLALRGEDHAFAAFVPADLIPAPIAAPWAFVGAGDAYATLGSAIVNQPASGHYSPVKNAIAGSVFADQLDYAATPVRFGTAIAATQDAQQTIRLTPVAGGYAPIVAADSPYVETTTLTVSDPSGVLGSYPVTLASADGDVVAGLVLTSEDLQTVTLSTADTRFTRGAQLIAGSPIASFEVCRPGLETCLDVGALTLETLTMRSTSVSPTGEPLTAVWSFGDGSAPSTETDTTTTHSYARPGTKTVNLTVQTPSGKRASLERDLVINNRAPSINSLTIAPTPIYVDSTPRVRALVSDADGGALRYTWTIDGVTVPGLANTANSLLLTPSVLENTTDVAGLEKRTYVVGVAVTDGQGGLTNGVLEFTVGDRGASVAPIDVSVDAFPDAPTILAGDTLRFTTSVSDMDDAIDRVVVDVSDGATAFEVELEAVDGVWTGLYGPVSAGAHIVRGYAYPVGGGAASMGPATFFTVSENSAPVVTIVGANVTESGRIENYTIEASDGDGRGFQRVELLDGATVLGGADGAASAVVSVPMDSVGFRTLTARAVDANGAEATFEYSVAVDDGVAIAMSVRRLAVNATDSHQVAIRVTRTDGSPVVHQLVTIEDFYATIPRPIDTQELHTDLNGEIVVRLAPEAIVIGVPLTRTIRATVNADSADGAPVQDVETAVAEVTLRNPAGPFAVLPLP